MSLYDYVGRGIAEQAGFDFSEPSFRLKKRKKSYSVYHTTYPPETNSNLVVIQAEDSSGGLYFNAFEIEEDSSGSLLDRYYIL